MAGDHDDLLPLFLAEAAERLQRLDDAVGRLPDDPEAEARARRELHALKGATRMIGIAVVAYASLRDPDDGARPACESLPSCGGIVGRSISR